MLGAVILLSFAILGFYGTEIFRTMPPFPTKVVTTEGEVLFKGQDIKDGQNVWQSIGGQTVGSIWGHGAYIAPDWNADYLHRESKLMLDKLAQRDGLNYATLSPAEQAKYQVLLQEELRKNTFDPTTGVITYSPLRAEVAKEIGQHYSEITPLSMLSSVRPMRSAPSLSKTRRRWLKCTPSLLGVRGYA